MRAASLVHVHVEGVKVKRCINVHMHDCVSGWCEDCATCYEYGAVEQLAALCTHAARLSPLSQGPTAWYATKMLDPTFDAIYTYCDIYT